MNSRQIIKKVGFLLEIIPLNILIKITGNKVLLPFYHAVSNQKLSHIDHLYASRDVNLFINDLNFFCKYFKPISIEELSQIVLENRKVTKPVFHLTFDDGLTEIYNVIAPILYKKKIPATFFVNTDFIDNNDLFFRYKVSLIIHSIYEHSEGNSLSIISSLLKLPISERESVIKKIKELRFDDILLINKIGSILNIDFDEFLSTRKPYLSSSEIVELMEKGFTFGSHSLNHPLFNELTTDQQKKQISESFNYLSINFNLKRKYFSFPFTDDKVGKHLFNWMNEVENCKLSFGISGLKRDSIKSHLHRIQMENNFDTANRIIKTEYLHYILKMIFFKTKINRYD